MKESVTAAVRFQPAPQIMPAADFMHRLVLDEFLENDSRRAPIDPLQNEKSPIEPRHQKVCEICFDRRPLRMPIQLIQKLTPYRNQLARAAWRHIQAPDQLLAWRLDHALQLSEILGRWLIAVGASPSSDLYGIGRELPYERVEKFGSLRLGKRLIGQEHLARQASA